MLLFLLGKKHDQQYIWHERKDLRYLLRHISYAKDLVGCDSDFYLHFRGDSKKLFKYFDLLAPLKFDEIYKYSMKWLIKDQVKFCSLIEKLGMLERIHEDGRAKEKVIMERRRISDNQRPRRGSSRYAEYQKIRERMPLPNTIF